MDFPISRKSSQPFPWRTATVVAVAVAVAELVLLFVVGGALLFKPDGQPTRKAAPAAARSAKASTAKAGDARATPAKATARKPAAATAAAELPRRKVSVLVLNGNGRTGAASVAANRVGHRGYKVSAVANAPRQDYPQSIVLFRRGFEGEGQRLAKDLGVHVVGPLDGMRTSQLHGAHVVLILGN